MFPLPEEIAQYNFHINSPVWQRKRIQAAHKRPHKLSTADYFSEHGNQRLAEQEKNVALRACAIHR